MLRLLVDVLVGLIVRFKVATLSHPALFVKCAVCEPAPVNVNPFHEYGNALGQMLRLFVDVLVGLIVRFKVAALSHPALFVKCAVCEPVLVNVNPFHEYGNALGQMLRLLVDVLVGLMVRFKVAALSHPTLFARCAVCDPAPVNVNPFHE